MADRLQELLQQRALIKEHLAWIEGEISAASGRPIESGPLTSPAVSPLPTPLPSSRTFEVKSPLISGSTGPRLRDDAERLIAKLAAEEEKAPAPTKKGCWIFFWTTLVTLGAAAWAVLRFFYRD
jgi:hypothetical protein